MNKFIELPEKDKNVLINIHHIVKIAPDDRDGLTNIFLSDGISAVIRLPYQDLTRRILQES